MEPQPHLTKLTKYNIEDSNIALLGSDLEKRVREHGGDKEPAWANAGTQPGLQIWRIEKFHVVPWPKAEQGKFYDGDSYIVLFTYKKTPKADSFSYDLHFWLGEDTSQDEAGTAAYKTVELDDHLHGTPVQYREIQSYESPQFLSHFPHGFVCLKGGVSTGFHHVSEIPPVDMHKLYRISIVPNPHTHSSHAQLLAIRQVPFAASSLIEGDVFVLDKGTKVWQLNTKESAGKEKFRAAEFVRSIVEERKGGSEVTVFGGLSFTKSDAFFSADTCSHGTGTFLFEFGKDTAIQRDSEQQVAPPTPADETTLPPNLKLFRLSDSSGTPTFTAVEPPISLSSLSSTDAFLLDYTSSDSKGMGMYIWLGSQSSLTERRLAVEYAQRYLHDKAKGGDDSGKSKDRKAVAIPIVKMQEGHENDAFLALLGGS
ncbi:actin regulatory protein [Rhodocollybia butyracea]|uniref:Actin regulatory protein n=1 Tax=Rhodocollybia butyracea TaxID=206335 RepID=A0A9P5PG30_9AGAR|nr:actin regulatory protein [Rhodocollybia butyracea]